MKSYNLRTLIFLSLCCDLGLFSKRLIGPLANVVTEFLHIPGGIATGFSLMFLVVAAVIVPKLGCASAMGAVQSVLALAFGMVGSMGGLAFIGYIVPGIAIDLTLALTRKLPISLKERMILTNAIAAVCASLSANFIVFRLRGLILLLYLCVSASFGALFGTLGERIVRRITPIFDKPQDKKSDSSPQKVEA